MLQKYSIKMSQSPKISETNLVLSDNRITLTGNALTNKEKNVSN